MQTGEHHGRSPFTRPSDWRDTPRAIAHASGFESYSDIPVNVYGVTAPAGSDHLPDPPMVDAEHMERIRARCMEARGIVHPVEIAGLLYGDEPLAMNGHPVLGCRSHPGSPSRTMSWLLE